MTINTKYNCLDKVYAIVDNKIQECSIRKISFSCPNRLLPDSIDVFYHILHLKDVKYYNDFGIQEPESIYIIKRENELGFTKAELMCNLINETEKQ